MPVQAREAAPSVAVPVHPTSPESSAVQAAAIPVRGADGLSAAALLAIGGVLFGAACLLLIALLRRSSPDRGSLITQSMREGR